MIPLETVSAEQKETALADIFETLLAEVAAISPLHRIGRISEIGRGTVQVTGLTMLSVLEIGC